MNANTGNRVSSGQFSSSDSISLHFVPEFLCKNNWIAESSAGFFLPNCRGDFYNNRKDWIFGVRFDSETRRQSPLTCFRGLSCLLFTS